MTQRERDICESMGWTVSPDDTCVDLQKFSPAGEDFIFTVTEPDNFTEGVRAYADDFDIDEHIAMWIMARQNGGVGIPSVRDLVKDAEDIDAMLGELAMELCKAKGGQEP